MKRVTLGVLLLYSSVVVAMGSAPKETDSTSTLLPETAIPQTVTSVEHYLYQAVHGLSYEDQLSLYPYLAVYSLQQGPSHIAPLQTLISQLIAHNERDKLLELARTLVEDTRSDLSISYTALFTFINTLPPSNLKTEFAMEVTQALADTQNLKALIELSELMTTLDDKTPIYALIAQGYLAKEDIAVASTYISKVQRPSEKDRLLRLLALQLVDTEYLTTIEAALTQIQTQSALSQTYSELAVAFSEVDKYDLTFKYMHKITDDFELYQKTMGQVLVRYAQQGKFDSANQLLNSITDEQLKINIRNQLTYYYFEHLSYTEGFERLKLSKDLPTSFRVAERFGGQEAFFQFDQLKELIPEIPTPSLDESFASGYFKTKYFFPEAALGVASFPEAFVSSVYLNTIEELKEQGNFTQALRLVEKVESPRLQQQLFIDIGSAASPTTNHLFITDIASKYDALLIKDTLTATDRQALKLSLSRFYIENNLIEAGELLLGFLIEDLAATGSPLLLDSMKLRMSLPLDEGLFLIFSRMSLDDQVKLLPLLRLNTQQEKSLLSLLVTDDTV